jgi:hypothetical protein
MMGHYGMEEDVQGAEELDLVYSGLEEIMSTACRETWNLS